MEKIDTLKIVQAYVKECLDVFVNSTKLSDAHVLRLPMLSFIKDLCSKKVWCLVLPAELSANA